MLDMPERSYCAHCGYPLRGANEPRCGGCGRAFNPADPSTFGRSREPRLSLPWRVAIGSMIYPVLPAAMLLLTYFLAQRALGQPPEPGFDDPARMVGPVRVCGDITRILIRALPAAMGIGMLAVCVIPCVAKAGRRLQEFAGGSMILLMGWSAWFGCAALPMRAMLDWFLS